MIEIATIDWFGRWRTSVFLKTLLNFISVIICQQFFTLAIIRKRCHRFVFSKIMQPDANLIQLTQLYVISIFGMM